MGPHECKASSLYVRRVNNKWVIIPNTHIQDISHIYNLLQLFFAAHFLRSVSKENQMRSGSLKICRLSYDQFVCCALVATSWPGMSGLDRRRPELAITPTTDTSPINCPQLRWPEPEAILPQATWPQAFKPSAGALPPSPCLTPA